MRLVVATCGQVTVDRSVLPGDADITGCGEPVIEPFDSLDIGLLDAGSSGAGEPQGSGSDDGGATRDPDSASRGEERIRAGGDAAVAGNVEGADQHEQHRRSSGKFGKAEGGVGGRQGLLASAGAQTADDGGAGGGETSAAVDRSSMNESWEVVSEFSP